MKKRLFRYFEMTEGEEFTPVEPEGTPGEVETPPADLKGKLEGEVPAEEGGEPGAEGPTADEIVEMKAKFYAELKAELKAKMKAFLEDAPAEEGGEPGAEGPTADEIVELRAQLNAILEEEYHPEPDGDEGEPLEAPPSEEVPVEGGEPDGDEPVLPEGEVEGAVEDEEAPGEVVETPPAEEVPGEEAPGEVVETPPAEEVPGEEVPGEEAPGEVVETPEGEESAEEVPAESEEVQEFKANLKTILEGEKPAEETGETGAEGPNDDPIAEFKAQLRAQFNAKFMKVLEGEKPAEETGETGAEGPNKDEIVEKLVDAEMLAVMEDEQEIEEKKEEIDEQNELIDDVDEAIERLEHIKGTIEKYGLSAPMMEIVDPQRELVQMGICPAYEELEELPIKDDQSEAVVEGIGDAITSVWKKITGVMKSIAVKIKDASINDRKIHGQYLEELTSIQNGLKDITIDDEKFGAISVRSVKKEDYKKIISAHKLVQDFVEKTALFSVSEQLVSYMKSKTLDAAKIDSIIKKGYDEVIALSKKTDLLSIVGLEIEVNDNRLKQIKFNKATFHDDRADVKSLGWTSAEMEGFIKDALTRGKETMSVYNQYMNIYKIHVAVASMIDDKLTIMGDWDKEMVSNFKRAYLGIRDLLRTLDQICYVAMYSEKILLSSAVQVGKAALKAKK